MKKDKTEEEIKQEKIFWHQNKIKGGFAEEVCKSHFQYLDFDVTPSGIEHIAPQYTKYKNRIGTKSNAVKKVLDKNPDLLVSNEKKAFLVEVKFRSGIKTPEDFYILGDELLFDYRYMLFRCNRLSHFENKKDFIGELNNLPIGEMEKELCENFIFYVVLPERDQKYNSYVHIFIPKNYRTKENGRGWRNAQDSFVNDELDIDNFNIGYHEIVKPTLDRLLNSSIYTILSVIKKDAKEFNSSWNGEMQEIKTDKGVFIDNFIGKSYYGYAGQNWKELINKQVFANVKFDNDQYWLRIVN